MRIDQYNLSVICMQALPAPTKLYLPIVSELAALSNRKEYLASDLKFLSRYTTTFHDLTDLAEILR